jgi:hypothetical protein
MELEIKAVRNGNTPSAEYVILQATEDTNLNLFAVVDSTFNPDGSMSNEHRHVYFFPAKTLKKGDWVLLTTGKGINGTVRQFTDIAEKYYEYFWQSGSCIWNDTGDNASLIRYSNGNTVKVPAIKK